MPCRAGATVKGRQLPDDWLKMPGVKNTFSNSSAYELGMGRLSRIAGEKFLDWLSLESGLRWLDLGCGTGSFTELILDRNVPSAISAIDPSEEQIAFAKSKSSASDVDYRLGDAMKLPFNDEEFDVAAMALVIQYIPDPAKAMTEIVRVVRPGGIIAAYVWPAMGEGHPLQPLNDAAKSIGVARAPRPGNRFRTVEALVDPFAAARLGDIRGSSMEIQVNFSDFNDYWYSQTGETVRTMTNVDVDRLKGALQRQLPQDERGQISISARVNVVRGQKPER